MPGYRLLIVDDDPTDRQIIARSLKQAAPDPCYIQQAAYGAAGLTALRADQFDCVFLDFNLPDMTGLEFLAAATVDAERPYAVVLVTGHGNEAIAVEAMKSGAQDYLVKDQINAASLWRALTQAVSKLDLQRRLADSLRDLKSLNLALEQEVVTRRAAEAELRAAKDVAERANQAKTRFVAMVTHELRTPLNGVLGYAELLRVEGGLSARQDARVSAMMQAGRHLLDLIERVLDFSIIESGRIELHPEQVSVRDLAEGCLAVVGPMATERGLKLRVVQSHDVPRQIVADPGRLRQVILNLLGNAVKFTDTGSVELRLSASASPGGLRVEIADTGRGIDPASRGRLFQDFERLDAAGSIEGAGLGLAIAARIVALMGGTIKHLPNSDGANPNGTNPDAGSVFSFEVPTGELASPVLSNPVQSVSSSGILRVLLVDDIQINLDIIGAFLKAAGHVVTMAESGPESIRLAAEQQFDLILMDVRMPGMDGLEATRHIRALPGTLGQMPILALTAHTFPDQVARCEDAGMDGHLPKPIDYATLIKAVEQAARRVPPLHTRDLPAQSLTDFPTAEHKAQPLTAPPTEEHEAQPLTALATAEKPAPRLDRVILDELFRVVPRDKIAVILEALRERQEEMLGLLDQRAAPALLADVAHALTSASGTFGFGALSMLARDYERELTQDGPRSEELARGLRAEICAARPTLDAVMSVVERDRPDTQGVGAA